MKTVCNIFRGKNEEEKLKSAVENLQILIEEHARDNGIHAQYAHKNRKGPAVTTPFGSPNESQDIIIEEQPHPDQESKQITFKESTVTVNVKFVPKSKIPVLNKELKSALKKSPLPSTGSNVPTPTITPQISILSADKAPLNKKSSIISADKASVNTSIGKSKFRLDLSTMKQALTLKPNMFNIVREKQAKHKQIKFIKFNQELKKKKRKRPLVVERKPWRDYQEHPFNLVINVGPDEELARLLNWPLYPSTHEYEATATAAEKLGLVVSSGTRKCLKKELKKEKVESETLINNYSYEINENEPIPEHKHVDSNFENTSIEITNNEATPGSSQQYLVKERDKGYDDEETIPSDVENIASKATESELDDYNSETKERPVQSELNDSNTSLASDSIYERYETGDLIDTDDVGDQVQSRTDDKYTQSHDEENSIATDTDDDMLYLVEETADTEEEKNVAESGLSFKDQTELVDEYEEKEEEESMHDEEVEGHDDNDARAATYNAYINDRPLDYSISKRPITPNTSRYENIELIHADTETDIIDDKYESGDEHNYSHDRNDEDNEYTDSSDAVVSNNNNKVRIIIPSDTSEDDMDKSNQGNNYTIKEVPSESVNNLDETLENKADESENYESDSVVDDSNDDIHNYVINAPKSRTSGDIDSGFVTKNEFGNLPLTTDDSHDAIIDRNPVKKVTIRDESENDSEVAENSYSDQAAIINADNNIVTLADDEDDYYYSKPLSNKISTVTNKSQDASTPKKLINKTEDDKFKPSDKASLQSNIKSHDRAVQDVSDNYQDVIEGSDASESHYSSLSEPSNQLAILSKKDTNNRLMIPMQSHSKMRDEKSDSGVDASEDLMSENTADDDNNDNDAKISETDEENSLQVIQYETTDTDSGEKDLKNIFKSLETIIGDRLINDIAIAVYSADGKPFKTASYFLLDVIDRTNDKFLGTMWLTKKKYEYAESKGFFKQMLTAVILGNESENNTLNETEQILTIKTPRPGVDKKKPKKLIKDNDCKSIMNLISKINNKEIASEVGIQYLFNLTTFYDMRIIAKPDYTNAESIYIITFMDNKRNKLGTIKLSATEILLIIQRNKQIAQILKIQINDSDENINATNNNNNNDTNSNNNNNNSNNNNNNNSSNDVVSGTGRVFNYFRNFFR